MNIKKCIGILVVVAMVCAFSSVAMGKKLLKDYNAIEVQTFVVPPNVAAPDTSGEDIADKIVYQVRRYAQKYGGFDAVVRAGSKKMPAGKKIMLIKGEVTEYTRPTVGRRVRRRFIPGGEYTSTAAFAAHYQFIDKATGEVIYETDLRTGAHYNSDTVDYAMERNAEAAAKVIYKLK